MDLFLDCETPEDLSKHLFLSFLRPALTQSQLSGNHALCTMAAISSNTALATVTCNQHNTRGIFGLIN